MEVRLADCAGFCFGVKRAVDTVYEQLKNGKTIYTYGPIVHNEEVVRELAKKGVRVLERPESRGDHSHCDHPCPWSGKRNL